MTRDRSTAQRVDFDPNLTLADLREPRAREAIAALVSG
jgi:hypothetical protein